MAYVRDWFFFVLGFKTKKKKSLVFFLVSHCVRLSVVLSLSLCPSLSLSLSLSMFSPSPFSLSLRVCKRVSI